MRSSPPWRAAEKSKAWLKITFYKQATSSIVVKNRQVAAKTCHLKAARCRKSQTGISVCIDLFSLILLVGIEPYEKMCKLWFRES